MAWVHSQCYHLTPHRNTAVTLSSSTARHPPVILVTSIACSAVIGHTRNVKFRAVDPRELHQSSCRVINRRELPSRTPLSSRRNIIATNSRPSQLSSRFSSRPLVWSSTIENSGARTLGNSDCCISQKYLFSILHTHHHFAPTPPIHNPPSNINPWVPSSN